MRPCNLLFANLHTLHPLQRRLLLSLHPTGALLDIPLLQSLRQCHIFLGLVIVHGERAAELVALLAVSLQRRQICIQQLLSKTHTHIFTRVRSFDQSGQHTRPRQERSPKKPLTKPAPSPAARLDVLLLLW